VSRVTIQGLDRSFAGKPVLAGVALDVADGEIMAVLGPSGCGKTTLLRIVAGFLGPDSGSVCFDGQPVATPDVQVAPQRRRVGYVPQEGALFPHLDVRGNVLFGLPRAQRTPDRLTDLLDLCDLPGDVADRYPHQLSGGQQQRVALARALAPRPGVVLLDEPFSSLDASLRITAGRAVTRVLRAAGTTALLVTHDQGEALSLADRVAVMRGGRIAQVAAPAALYRSPLDPEVAAFVGGATVLPADLHGDTATCALGDVRLAPALPGDPRGGRATVMVRPEQIKLSSPDAGPVVAVVEEVAFYGSYATVRLDLDGVVEAVARVDVSRMPTPGDKVAVSVEGDVVVFR
jgi:iron(III) transport system ATP-binding protein